MNLPDLLIIGAMKCATSTLHDQLARQRGVFMSEPKEPCFFSDDDVYARGMDWYADLFAAAKPGDLKGESSTHYTKLPTYPRTVERCLAAVPEAKLIYVVRDPIDRLISQYIHEWTMRKTSGPLDRAVDELPILVDYSRYAMQLRPWLDAYGSSRVLPVFFERLTRDPHGEFARIAAFLDLPDAAWDDTEPPQNASAQRLRRSPLRDALLEAPGFAWARRRLCPQSVRDRIKGLWTMRRRPALSAETRARVERDIDADLVHLGAWVGRELSCSNWKTAVRAGEAPEWVGESALAATSAVGSDPPSRAASSRVPSA